MKIDSLAAAPDRAGRYLVKFSDGSTMRLYRLTVEDFGLYTGMELSDTDIAALRSAAGKMSAKMRAVRIVAASSVSCEDLQQRLVQKGEAPQQAKEAVQWLSELNLLDDRQTACQIAARCAAKGYGIARAKQALFEKRIPKEFWGEALSDYPDQLDHITDFLRARICDTDDSRQIKRAIEALLRRGHSYGMIQRALRRLNRDDFSEE